jgi:hypothetical protein
VFPAALEMPELLYRLPKITSVLPQGARPGESVHAEIQGEFLGALAPRRRQDAMPVVTR